MQKIFDYFQTLFSTVDEYNELYQQIVGKYEKEDINNLRPKIVETRFDQYYEVLKKNELILAKEQTINEMTDSFINYIKNISQKIKNENGYLSHKNNEIVDKMKEENKKRNKNKKGYKETKSELNELYIETDEFLKKKGIEMN